MPSYTLGIDIREEFAALALVRKTLGGADLVRSHWFRLLTPGESGDPGDHFASEMADFLDKGKIKPQTVILSLPRKCISVQSFDLPVPEADALDDMILMEMERHFPFPLESSHVSYHVQPISPQRNHILAAAASRESVGQYLDWLGRAGLKADRVIPALAAQISLLKQTRETNESLQALVDIGSNRVEISLVKRDTLVTTRSLPVSMPDFQKLFFHHDLPESLTGPVAGEFADFLAEALESTLYGCKSLESEESISRIHLYGGGHALEFLSAPLEVATDVLTQKALPVFLKKDTPLSFNPSFQMTALALAATPFLRDPAELNLHPQAKNQARQTPQWQSTIILAVLGPAVLTAILLAQNYRNDQTLASLDRQLEALKPLAAGLEKIDREYTVLEEQAQTLNLIERGSPQKLLLLQELSLKLPKDTWVTRLSVRENQVEIRGYSASASGLIPVLEQSDFLKDTRFKGSVTTQKQGKSFTIQTTMEPRG